MRLAVLVVAALVLSGCSKPAEKEDPESCTEADCQAIVGTDGGSILGVAVDEAIFPVPNATVRILHGADAFANVTTDGKGAFAFHGLEPGFYFLQASRPGFTPAQTQVEVLAAEETRAKIMLSREPIPAKMAPTIQFDGIMGCSWYGIVFWLQLCSILGDTVGEPLEDDSYRVFTEDFDALGAPDFVQFELTWESTQALGDGLTMMVYSSERTTYDQGGSPLVRSFNATQVADRQWGAGGSAAVQIWSGAHEYPVGMTFQQDFQLFVTPFYGFTPEPGWTFIQDGSAKPGEDPSQTTLGLTGGLVSQHA